jgi:hypothetical protein
MVEITRDGKLYPYTVTSGIAIPGFQWGKMALTVWLHCSVCVCVRAWAGVWPGFERRGLLGG